VRNVTDARAHIMTTACLILSFHIHSLKARFIAPSWPPGFSNDFLAIEKKFFAWQIWGVWQGRQQMTSMLALTTR